MSKRIIPCLDVRSGRVVKGKKFQNVQDVADPVTLAKKYENEGADELFILDITGDEREQFLSLVRQLKDNLSIPLTVGGGIRSFQDAKETFQAGADKVSVTSAAISHPELLSAIAQAYGSESLVLSIDAGQVAPNRWHAFTQGGKHDTELDVIEWAKKGARLGAGEILLNSIDTDGVKEGFNLPLNKTVTEAVNIPVIASGGAGKKADFLDILKGKTNAALAASVFHYNEINIKDLKAFLQEHNIPIKES